MRDYNKLLILVIIASIFNGCSSSSSTEDTTTQPTTIESKSLEPSGWYMRVTVQATDENGKTYIHNNAGVFGELIDSLDGLDRHDIPAKGNAILQVRFVNPNLDKDKEYYSDYRSYEQNKTKESWNIIVINNDSSVDLSDSRLKIDIQNLKNIYKINNQYKEILSLDTTKRDSLKIIDIDNQKVYNYTELENTKLSMDNKYLREFKLVLGDVTQEDMKPFSTDIQPKQLKTRSFTKGFGLPPE